MKKSWERERDGRSDILRSISYERKTNLMSLYISCQHCPPPHSSHISHLLWIFVKLTAPLLKHPPEIGWCIRKNKNKIWKYFAKSKYSLCQWCTFNLDLILYNYVPFTIIYIMLQQRKRTTRMLWGRKISCDISVTKFSSSYFLYVATWH